MAAERSRARVADIVATTVLAIAGCLIGLGYGYLTLVLTPVSALAVWWVVLGVALMLVPVATTIAGIQRIRRGRTGFWMPLAGGVAVAVIIGLLSALSASL